MACYHPVVVPIKRKSLSGRGVYDELEVGCGVCLGCRAEQARDWAVRIMHELEMHESAWFVTLTYSNEELPENGSLRPEDLRGFFKALRRQYKEVRYYVCGEYGEISQRPHYHAVLFGPDFLDRSAVRSSGASDVWRSECLERAWPYGLSEFGSVNYASASYVAGYVQKKVTARQDPEAYLRVDDETGELVYVEREFARMSLRPALGRRWLRQFWSDVYPRDFIVMNGREYRPPRYYDKLMDGDCRSDEPCFAGKCEVHKRLMMEVREKRIGEHEDVSEYHRQAREKAHEARSRLFASRSGV